MPLPKPLPTRLHLHYCLQALSLVAKLEGSCQSGIFQTGGCQKDLLKLYRQKVWNDELSLPYFYIKSNQSNDQSANHKKVKTAYLCSALPHCLVMTTTNWSWIQQPTPHINDFAPTTPHMHMKRTAFIENLMMDNIGVCQQVSKSKSCVQ